MSLKSLVGLAPGQVQKILEKGNIMTQLAGSQKPYFKEK